MIRLEVRKKSDRIRRAIETAYLDMWRNAVKGIYPIQFVYHTGIRLEKRENFRRLTEK